MSVHSLSNLWCCTFKSVLFKPTRWCLCVGVAHRCMVSHELFPIMHHLQCTHAVNTLQRCWHCNACKIILTRQINTPRIPLGFQVGGTQGVPIANGAVYGNGVYTATGSVHMTLLLVVISDTRTVDPHKLIEKLSKKATPKKHDKTLS